MTSQPDPAGHPFDILAGLFQGPQAHELPKQATPKTLRSAIADAISDAKAYEVAAECVRFGLEPAEEREDPWAGKYRYVEAKLKGLTLEELTVLGHKVIVDYPSDELEHLLALAGAGGVAGELKNLIFAADGPKPRIVLRDAVNNDIEILGDTDRCLVYDRPLPPEGLTWRALVAWWAKTDKVPEDTERDVALDLYGRLKLSLGDNEAEKFLFDTYGALYRTFGFDLPALVPQVYLHYDPYTKKEGSPLVRQRMEFLLLLPNRRRIILELDGKQHYSDSTGPRPDLYASMVAEDRKLRLDGYEVYRFGGQEFVNRRKAEVMLRGFFHVLLKLPVAP